MEFDAAMISDDALIIVYEPADAARLHAELIQTYSQTPALMKLKAILNEITGLQNITH